MSEFIGRSQTLIRFMIDGFATFSDNEEDQRRGRSSTVKAVRLGNAMLSRMHQRLQQIDSYDTAQDLVRAHTPTDPLYHATSIAELKRQRNERRTLNAARKYGHF
jgi:hypothetical protein